MALEIPKAKLKSFVRHVVPGECCRPSKHPANGGSSIAKVYFPSGMAGSIVQNGILNWTMMDNADGEPSTQGPFW